MHGEPNQASAFLRAMALSQSRVHSHPATHLASLKARLTANIRQAGILGERRQTSLLGRLAALPEGDRLCHGDFHSRNILGRPGQEVLVDWLDASRGDPAADVCRSYVLIRHSYPELASEYIDTYANFGNADRDRILSWLPAVAGARLAEGVPNEVDELMEMADCV
jgi:Ser/Thr protein kinase RdoA (MazF antagonist)